MGCGQSRIGNFYSKNKKSKGSASKNDGFPTRSASIEQRSANGSKANKTNNNTGEIGRDDDQDQDKKKPSVPGIVGGSVGGPLLQQMEVSSSQLDFFKMLDEKIESGPDLEEQQQGPGSHSVGLAPPHAAHAAGTKHSLRRAHRVVAATGLLDAPMGPIVAERRHSLRELARLDGLDAALPVSLVAEPALDVEPAHPHRLIGQQQQHRALEAISQSPTLRPSVT